MALRNVMSQLPLVLRSTIVGAVGAGIVGAVAGLIVGLLVYPPTAWFAMFELGLPAVGVGALLGLAVGGVILLARRLRR